MAHEKQDSGQPRVSRKESRTFDRLRAQTSPSFRDLADRKDKEQAAGFKVWLRCCYGWSASLWHRSAGRRLGWGRAQLSGQKGLARRERA